MMAVMRFCLRPRAGRLAHSLACASRNLATSYLYVEVTRRRPLEPRLLYGSNPFLRKQKIAAVTFSFHHAPSTAAGADALRLSASAEFTRSGGHCGSSAR